MRHAARDSDVLITVSNDTWFGQSIGPHQHLQLARMRAVENSRYVLRATNNGITAVINPRGQVVASLPQFEAGVLRERWAPVSGTTPYTRFGDTGLVVLLCGLWLVLAGRRLRSSLA